MLSHPQSLDSTRDEPLQEGFCLGSWRVEPCFYRVSGANGSVTLEPKVMQVLVRLAACAGEVVSRHELRQVGWGNSYAAEEGLRRAVMLLRRLFQDDARTPRVIETIPRVGYRLLVGVTPRVGRRESSEPALVEPPVIEQPVIEPPVIESPGVTRRWRRIAAGLVTIGLTALLAVATMVITEPDRPVTGTARSGVFETSKMLRMETSDLLPLTSYPGRERDVSLSPDGQTIAFVWETGAAGEPDIFIRGVDAETPIQVNLHSDREAHPAWSPDGSTLAYARYGEAATQLLLTPVAGGDEVEAGRLPAEELYGLDWSPDGRWLTFAQRPAPGETVALFRFEVETGFQERLTAPPSGVFGDLDPAWSPNGEELVFVRRGVLGVSDLFSLRLAERTLRQLTEDRQAILRPAWMPDGDAVLFVRWRSDRYGLSWVARDGGAVVDLDLGSDHIVSAAVAFNSHRLVVERLQADTDLWRFDLADAPHPQRWLSSSATDRLPAFSADSGQVAFVSDRSGAPELWVAEGSAAHARRLTSFASGVVGRPQWSPDGRSIAFDSSFQQQVDVYVIAAAGGEARRLTHHPSEDCLPSWSRDGRTVYFASNRSGRWQIWRQAVKGGEPRPFTDNGGLTATESFDGRWLYFIKPAGISGLWRQPVSGGDESLVLAEFDPTVDWALTPDGVYYVDPEAADRGAVIYRDLPGGEGRTVVQLAHKPRELGMAVSGDGRYLALALLDTPESDLLMTQW